MSVSRLKWWEQSPFCVSTRHCSLSLFRMALSLVSDRVLTYMLSALLCIRRPPRSLGFSLWAALAPGFSVLSTLVAFVSLYFQRHRPNSESLSEKKKRKSIRLHLNSPALCCCCLETLKAVNLDTCRTHFICFPSVKDHCLSSWISSV